MVLSPIAASCQPVIPPPSNPCPPGVATLVGQEAQEQCGGEVSGSLLMESGKIQGLCARKGNQTVLCKPDPQICGSAGISRITEQGVYCKDKPAGDSLTPATSPTSLLDGCDEQGKREHETATIKCDKIPSDRTIDIRVVGTLDFAKRPSNCKDNEDPLALDATIAVGAREEMLPLQKTSNWSHRGFNFTRKLDPLPGVPKPRTVEIVITVTDRKCGTTKNQGIVDIIYDATFNAR